MSRTSWGHHGVTEVLARHGWDYGRDWVYHRRDYGWDWVYHGWHYGWQWVYHGWLGFGNTVCALLLRAGKTNSVKR